MGQKEEKKEKEKEKEKKFLHTDDRTDLKIITWRLSPTTITTPVQSR